MYVWARMSLWVCVCECVRCVCFSMYRVNVVQCKTRNLIVFFLVRFITTDSRILALSPLAYSARLLRADTVLHEQAECESEREKRQVFQRQSDGAEMYVCIGQIGRVFKSNRKRRQQREHCTGRRDSANQDCWDAEEYVHEDVRRPNECMSMGVRWQRTAHTTTCAHNMKWNMWASSVIWLLIRCVFEWCACEKDGLRMRPTHTHAHTSSVKRVLGYGLHTHDFYFRFFDVRWHVVVDTLIGWHLCLVLHIVCCTCTLVLKCHCVLVLLSRWCACFRCYCCCRALSDTFEFNSPNGFHLSSLQLPLVSAPHRFFSFILQNSRPHLTGSWHSTEIECIRNVNFYI